MTLKKPIIILTILSLMVTMWLAMPQTALAVPGTCPVGMSMLTKYNWDDVNGWVVDPSYPDFITFGADSQSRGPDAQDGSWSSGSVLIQAVVITDGYWQGNVVTATYGPWYPGMTSGEYHAVDMAYQPINPHDISNIVFCGDTTPITLDSFTAKASRGMVTLNWVTATEIDTAGFILFRSSTEAGTQVQVTPDLIAAQGGGVTGASYSITDTPGNGTFYYWLVDVDYSGQSSQHGPAAAKLFPAIRSPEYRPNMPGY